MAISLLAEAINLYNLQRYTKVEECIIHFIILKIVTDLAAIYYNSMTDNKLKKLFNTPVRKETKGVDIKFFERRGFH